MDEWESIRNAVRSMENDPGALKDTGLRDISIGDYWKHKYEEEKRLYEERLIKAEKEEELRAEKQRFSDEQVKQLAAQIQALEQRMSWEKLLAEERFKIRDIEAENEKKRSQYEAQIRVKEEEVAGLKALLRQTQELYEEEKTAHQRAEAERKLLEQEYRAFLAQPRTVAAVSDDSRRVRDLESDKMALERKIHELETKASAGNPEAEKELAALRDEHAKALSVFEQREKEMTFSVEDIARGFAHKVRNYLGIMSGTLQLSLTNNKLDEELRGQIVTVDESAQEMLKVIEEYLTLTKVPQLDLQPTEVSALVNGAAELAEPKAQAAGVSIKKEVPAGLPKLTCDAAALKEALRQIVDNAVEASNNGASVTVSAKYDASAKDLLIEIVDVGKGIGENHFKKVYQPYFTNKKDRRGMGLSFAKRSIEHHQGMVSFTSVKGKGTTFTVTLPVKQKG